MAECRILYVSIMNTSARISEISRVRLKLSNVRFTVDAWKKKLNDRKSDVPERENRLYCRGVYGKWGGGRTEWKTVLLLFRQLFSCRRQSEVHTFATNGFGHDA